MAGIYIHVPFCKKACHYCNFHFSTSLKLKSPLINAICKEIDHRHDYLKEKKLDSIYFGGGTPSLLSESDLHRIFETLGKYFEWNSASEITLEANPDDINEENLARWKQMSINRLSIGIQSFYEYDLQWMNRAHNKKQAESCIPLARKAGFNNISADLIFALPDSTLEIWKDNLKKLLNYTPEHISCYNLTIEASTALAHFVKTGKVTPLDDSKAADQFLWASNYLSKHGYDHYEISNYGKGSSYAKHNSSYWQNREYLGIGPSAHSYNGKIRQWNLSNNPLYIKSIESHERFYESELLNNNDRYNEMVMTGLRTKWGIHLSQLEQLGSKYLEQFLGDVNRSKWARYFIQNGQRIVLDKRSWLFADQIASDLFILDESI